MLNHKNIKHVVVVGCSRFGANVASQFSKQNISVIIIDMDPAAFTKLSPDFSGFRIIGDATDIDVLKRADLSKADLFIASTNNDNVNIMISEIVSSHFKTKYIISRLYDEEKEIVYHDLNIRIIKPTKLSLAAFESLLDDYDKEALI